MSFDPNQFEVARNVTLPFILIPDNGEPIYLKFETAIEPDSSQFSARMRRSRKDGEQSSDKPVDIAKVVNLQTGELGRLLIHEVLKSNLTEAYPQGEYVGKMFQIKKSKAQGKRYFNFNIIELRPKTTANEQESTHAKKR